ncbi:MAG TPA: hypothetical protein VJV79_14855 [Polyangiaceae bacterium]|nr:hypothetical protein [Polyangiaceae bacterium]
MLRSVTRGGRRQPSLIQVVMAGVFALTLLAVGCGSDRSGGSAANAVSGSANGSASAGARTSGSGVGQSGSSVATASGGAAVQGGSGGSGSGTANLDPNVIPVRYVVLSSTDASSWQKRFPSWTDCTDATVDASEKAGCMPGAVLARFNDDFERIAAARPFARGSFEVLESPFTTLFTQKGDVDVCGIGTISAAEGTVLDVEKFTVPGTLTVIVVEDIEGTVAGFANTDQRLNASQGAYIVLEASAPLWAFEHELGHVFGLNHFLDTAQVYEHCGGASWDPAEYLTDCFCEFNVMGLLLWTVADDCTCHHGKAPTYKLDSPRAAEFVSHIASCWLKEQRHVQQCIVEYADESMICDGVEGKVSCECPYPRSTLIPQTYFTTPSCAAAKAEQLRADAISNCPKQCNARVGERYASCTGSPYELTCECNEGGPTFNVPGCSNQYSTLIEERATQACGIARCQSALMPEVTCEGVALDMIPCKCPNGQEFYTASDCSVLDVFVDFQCASE